MAVPTWLHLIPYIWERNDPLFITWFSKDYQQIWIMQDARNSKIDFEKNGTL